MRKGDIILTRGGIFTAWIGKQTDGKFTHAMIYTGDGHAFHTDTSSTKKIFVINMKFKHGNVGVYRVKRDLSNAELKLMSSYLDSQIGANYSYVDAVFSAKRFERKIERRIPDKKQFCSRLLVRAFREAGISLGLKGDFSSPNDLLKSAVEEIPECVIESRNSDSTDVIKNTYSDFTDLIDKFTKDARQLLGNNNIITLLDVFHELKTNDSADRKLACKIRQLDEYLIDCALVYGNKSGSHRLYENIKTVMASFGSDIESLYRITKISESCGAGHTYTAKALFEQTYRAIEKRVLEQADLLGFIARNTNDLQKNELNSVFSSPCQPFYIIAGEIYEKTGFFVNNLTELLLLAGDSEDLDEIIVNVLISAGIESHLEPISIDGDDFDDNMVWAYYNQNEFLSQFLLSMYDAKTNCKKQTRTSELIVNVAYLGSLHKINFLLDCIDGLSNIYVRTTMMNGSDFEFLLRESINNDEDRIRYNHMISRLK
jgi:hypothetical protein